MKDVKDDLREEMIIAKNLLDTYRAELGDDEKSITDFLEGETDLYTVMDAVIARIFELEDHIEALVEHGKKLNNRNSRFKAQRESLRMALNRAMEMARIKTLERPIGTISHKALPRTPIVQDAAQIPTEFLIEQPKKIDMRKLAEALKNGPIPGVELSNGGTTVSISRS